MRSRCDTCRSPFATKVGHSHWAKALAAQRGPRGAVLQRTLASTRFEKSFPGAPEGEYAVLAFRTAFENVLYYVNGTPTHIVNPDALKVLR